MPPGLQSRARVSCRHQNDGVAAGAFPVEIRPFRNGRWLYVKCEPGNESWSTTLIVLPSCGKHITLKSEDTIARMR